MKFLLIAYNEALDTEVMEVLKAAGVENYSKWNKVVGTGNTSGPHLASHVWPKANNMIGVAVEDNQAAPILQGVRDLRRTLGRQGIKAYQLPLEAVT